MKTILLRFGNSIKRSRFRRSLFLIPLALACFELLPKIHAVSLPPEGSYPNQNTAEAEDSLFSLTTGADNTTMGFDALHSNTTDSNNAPASRNWTVTGRLHTGRDFHTATLLRNGVVLVAGGSSGISPSAELYDPASGTWTATGSLNTVRAAHTATLLRNGMVLVAGGADSNSNTFASAELYDSASGTWTDTGRLNTARHSHTATLLQNGMVVVAGGLDTSDRVLARAELGHGHR